MNILSKRQDRQLDSGEFQQRLIESAEHTVDLPIPVPREAETNYEAWGMVLFFIIACFALAYGIYKILFPK